VLLIFGLGISARIAFGFMHGVIPITLFAMNAIRNIPPTMFRAGLVLHLSPRQTVTSIVLPAALPGIMTGVRLGVSITLLGVLIGEMFAAKRGLGSRLMNAIGNQDIPTILAVALLLSLFALVLNAALMTLSRRLNRRG
jgi:NitT/TauT family transport system permease protein